MNTKTHDCEESGGDKVPGYAIVSHRWGTEEVTPSTGIRLTHVFGTRLFVSRFSFILSYIAISNPKPLR